MMNKLRNLIKTKDIATSSRFRIGCKALLSSLNYVSSLVLCVHQTDTETNVRHSRTEQAGDNKEDAGKSATVGERCSNL